MVPLPDEHRRVALLDAGASADAQRTVDLLAEWVEPDGLGGYASGTVSGVRTRRYHALLLSAARPPTGRIALVNGVDARLCTPRGDFAISSQHYTPDVLSPDGTRRIEGFAAEPWPTWQFLLEDGVRVRQELFAVSGAAVTVLRFSLVEPASGIRLEVRPFLSGRDHHATHHENGLFRFEPRLDREWVRFNPYPGIPEVYLLSNGAYVHDPHWYRNFLYDEERLRGLDCVEDLASPGLFRFDLSGGPAALILASSLSELTLLKGATAVSCRRLADQEASRRSELPRGPARSAGYYLVRRAEGSTVIAGYPWFTDWGRDTFIAMRGLCLATGRLDEAQNIVVEWAKVVDRGMLPNYFPDGERSAEFNSVDASLWYVIAVHDFLRHLERAARTLDDATETLLWSAVDQILAGYAEGTRYRIGADPDDGLLRAGEGGVQLTWMDAKVGDWVVTPRIGKPVEVQALWINALAIGAQRSIRWRELGARASESFERRFWNEERGCLYDVVDADHVTGKVDASLRPNQILTVGGLPQPLLTGERARAVVEVCERTLLTPLGLRTLAPGEPGFAARYEGNQAARDAAYHQGTAWPWLLGPFVEAWVRVRGGGPQVKAEALARFVEPLEARMRMSGGLGHLPEIADAEEPFLQRGCTFQSWSL